jgi:hypothetical protein
VKEAEILELFVEIKTEYSYFDDSDENVERHLKYLHDIPFEVAMANVEQHIKANSKYPPGIADIRGRLGEQIERERMQAQTAEHVANLERWRQNDVPPPAGYWESMKSKLRGDSA